jgi:hypothetical protein
MQFNQFMQLNNLNIDGIFEIRELDFVYRIYQINKHDEIFDLINNKIIEAKSEFFEGRIEISVKFKYKNTGVK